MADLKKPEKTLSPILPPALTFEEAKEIFGHIEPLNNKVSICAPLPYDKTPGSGLLLSKDMHENSITQLSRRGAIVVTCPYKPEKEGTLIISSDYKGQHQEIVEIPKDITLHNGEVVENYPTKYLCIVVDYASLVCNI